MKILSKLGGCIVAAFIGISTVAAAQERTITVSTNNTPNDRRLLQGVSEQAFSNIGYTFELVSLPSERSLQSANAGEVDGEGLRVGGLSDVYPELVQIPEPYVGISFSAFATNPDIKIDGWDSLAPHRIAFITGWKMFENNATTARVVNKVDTPEQMFEMLRLGRIDLALYTKSDGLNYLKASGRTDVQLLEPSLKDVDLFLYLHSDHADLAPQVAKAIRNMKSDGSYDAILSSIYD